ncbi:MAG: hypothetical protein WCL14_05470 [Bacteroidota bacterium]
MKKERFILMILMLSIIISGCSRMGMSFTKRKYRSGYYLDFASRHKVQHYPNSKTFMEHSQDALGHYVSFESVNPLETFDANPSKQQEMTKEHPSIIAYHQPNKTIQPPFLNSETLKQHSILNDNPTAELPEKKGKGLFIGAMLALSVLLYLIFQSTRSFNFTINPMWIISLLILVAALFSIYLIINKDSIKAKKLDEKKSEEVKKVNNIRDYKYYKDYAVGSFLLSCVNLMLITVSIIIWQTIAPIFRFGFLIYFFFIFIIFLISFILAISAKNGIKKHPEVAGKIYADLAIYFLMLPAVIGIIYLLYTATLK